MARSNIFKVSQSKIKIWRRCKYAAYLRYVKKLRKKVKSRPLAFGTLVHEMLDAHANSAKPFIRLKELQTSQGKLFASQRDELDELIRDVRLIMQDYFEYWDEQPGKYQLEYIARKGKFAEHEIELELCPGIVLIVRLDGLAKTTEGRWLVEHKTFRAMPSEEHRWRDLQSNVYKWAIDELELKVDGICWDYIRSKSPPVPKLLKGGNAISEKRLDTIPSALREFFKEHGVESKRMLKTAMSTRSNYYQRLFRRFNQKTVKLVLTDFIESAKEMSEQLGILKAKTIDRHCEWCDYEGICRAELTGADVNFVIKKDYETHDREEKEVQAD